jgi:hypothetical protein
MEPGLLREGFRLGWSDIFAVVLMPAQRDGGQRAGLVINADELCGEGSKRVGVSGSKNIR